MGAYQTGNNSTTKGYFAGGIFGDHDEISELDFSSKTTATASATIPTGRQYLAGMQSGGIL